MIFVTTILSIIGTTLLVAGAAGYWVGRVIAVKDPFSAEILVRLGKAALWIGAAFWGVAISLAILT